MSLNAYLKVLSGYTGTDLQAVDDVCTLRFDDMEVVFQEIPEAGCILITALVGAPPPYPLEGLLSGMLTANHLFSGTGGATLSRHPETGDFWLCQNIPAEGLADEEFLKTGERFVTALETWRKALDAYRPEDSEERPVAPDSMLFTV